MSGDTANLWQRLRHFVMAVGLRFYRDGCTMRAASLAYSSLLSLVPLLAVMFAVLKGLGVQHRLEPLLLSRLSLDPTTTESIIGYIDRTNVGTLGTLGAALLIFTVVGVLSGIEASFNHIWRVEQNRGPWRQVTDYLGVVLLTPFLLLAAVALTSSMQLQSVLDWMTHVRYFGQVVINSVRLVPILFNAVAIGMLYTVMPNRRPYAPAVLLAAVLAGAGWQLVQWAYLRLQIGVANYNAIYGAMAQLPVTLVWLDVSWLVVLLGAEIAAVYEFGSPVALESSGAVHRPAVAIRILVRSAEAFESGGPPVALLPMARELGVTIETLQEVIDWLIARGWLARVEGEPPCYILARQPSTISLEPLAELIDTSSLPRSRLEPAHQLLQDLSTAERSVWAKWTLADIVHPPARDMK